MRTRPIQAPAPGARFLHGHRPCRGEVDSAMADVSEKVGESRGAEPQVRGGSSGADRGQKRVDVLKEAIETFTNLKDIRRIALCSTALQGSP
jgi:hypothetical protein